MKILVKVSGFNLVPPIAFALELPDEIGARFNPEFLRKHFTKYIAMAYADLQIFGAEELIDEVNKLIWKRKEALIEIVLKNIEQKELQKGG